jgi:hypothetical protein
MTHMHTNVHAQREKQEKLRHILTLTHATPHPTRPPCFRARHVEREVTNVDSWVDRAAKSPKLAQKRAFPKRCYSNLCSLVLCRLARKLQPVLLPPRLYQCMCVLFRKHIWPPLGLNVNYIESRIYVYKTCIFR